MPAQSLKGFLWGRWQRAWGLQHPDASRIKLVHFGQTIDDFTPLRCTFPTFGTRIKLWLTTLATRGILKFHASIVVHIAIETLTKIDHAGSRTSEQIT